MTDEAREGTWTVLLMQKRKTCKKHDEVKGQTGAGSEPRLRICDNLQVFRVTLPLPGNEFPQTSGPRTSLGPDKLGLSLDGNPPSVSEWGADSAVLVRPGPQDSSGTPGLHHHEALSVPGPGKGLWWSSAPPWAGVLPGCRTT